MGHGSTGACPHPEARHADGLKCEACRTQRLMEAREVNISLGFPALHAQSQAQADAGEIARCKIVVRIGFHLQRLSLRDPAAYMAAREKFNALKSERGAQYASFWLGAKRRGWEPEEVLSRV